MTQHTQRKVVELISKRPSERRDINIQIVLPWLRKKSDMMKDMDKDVLTDVIRNCAYQKANRDDIIIRQGDMGDRFYIMLTGSTSVYIDTTKSDDDPKAASEADDNGNIDAQNGDVSDDEDDTSSTDERSKKKPLDRKTLGKLIMRYESGKSFGEVALLSEDSVRNATIVADEDTDLLVISRELFNRSVKAKQEEEYQEKKEFIQRNVYFHNWSPKFRRLLEMSVRKEHYPAGCTIIRQGDPVMGLVFIIGGQAKVTVHPALHGTQFPILMKKELNPVAKEIGRDIYSKKEKHNERTFTQHQIQVRRKEGYAAAEKRVMSKMVDLCCIETNDVFGDIEMVLELERSAFTVTCIENTTIMVLDTKNYDRLIAKKNQHTINKLCAKALQKVNSRLLSGKGTQVPLFNVLQNKLSQMLPNRETGSEKPKADKQKSVVMEQLLKLFVEDKAPLIEPFVPNSLYYRMKSEKRAKTIEIREQKKRGSDVKETRVEERLYGFKPRRKIPRSLKQLKNVKVENDLLRNDSTTVTSASDTQIASSNSIIRPRTSIGIRQERPSRRENRPHTAGIFHLTECDGEPDVKSNPDANENVIANKIDAVQKSKNENRSKIVCSATAVSEIKSNLKSESSGSGSSTNIGVADPFDDDYFDWETSNKKLCSLEERIKQFCTEVDSKSYRDPPLVSSLRRFHIKDEKEDKHSFEVKVPKPGGTVFVRTRPCPSPGTTPSPADPNAHHHIRRFIVSRDEIPDYSNLFRRRPKSAAATMSRNSDHSIGRRPKTASVRSISVLG